MNKTELVFNPLIRNAISFSLEVHEVDQKQKRKGKDVPYIVHPLAVGLILARAGASDEQIAAGILHDTIEDSIPEKKITKEMLVERFGESVAEMVNDVTEQDRELPWKERKQEALTHIETMNELSVWVKSADTISNVSELLDDYEREGDIIFKRFGAPKENLFSNYLAVIRELLKRWGQSENPMVTDLKIIAQKIAAFAV